MGKKGILVVKSKHGRNKTASRSVIHQLTHIVNQNIHHMDEKHSPYCEVAVGLLMIWIGSVFSGCIESLSISSAKLSTQPRNSLS